MPTPGPHFLPWSLPAAFFLMAGIGLAAGGLSWPWLLGFGFFLPLILFFNYPRWTLLLLLAAPLGYLRYQLWEGQPDALTPLYGQTLSLSGSSDGRYLTLDEPKGARVVLSPKGVVAPGRVTLTGDLVQPAGKRNPGGFDYASYLARRGIKGQLFVDEVVHFEAARAGLKERLRRGIAQGLGERPAALMQAMTLGIRDDLGDLRDIFAASGLAHLLALSGLHVGILMTALGLLLGRLGLGLQRYPIMMLLVIGFVMLVGPTPSIVRAGAMTFAVLGSLWWGSGRLEPWAALALAALLTLSWNPSWLFDLSFQLSYLAVAGILLLTEPLMVRILGRDYYKLPWWSWQKLVVGSAVVSSAAQALSLPLVASTFGALPLFSPLVNVIALPLASLLVPLGFMAGLLGLLWLPLAGLTNLVTAIIATSLIKLADLAAGLPSLGWGEISALGYSFYYLAVLALMLYLWQRLKLWRALLVLSVAILSSMVSLPEHHPPEVVFLDVGQGDSALIRLPGRREILVDAGGSPFSDYDVGARTVVPALRALGVDELELVIATHADADHIEGLISVLKLMPVQRLVIGHRAEDSPLFNELIATAQQRFVPIIEVRRGEQLHVGSARLDILNPPQQRYGPDNDDSVAFVLSLDDQPKALFLGDASFEVEDDLAFPDVDLLMVGHHGSSSSTSEALLAAAQPELAVISYGRNGYGHPSDGVLERLSQHDIAVRETFREGAIRVPLERP